MTALAKDIKTKIQHLNFFIEEYKKLTEKVLRWKEEIRNSKLDQSRFEESS